MFMSSMDSGLRIQNKNLIVRRGKNHQPHRTFSQWMCYTVVAVAAVGCYLNSLWGEFVHDDIPAIVMNPDVKGDTDLSTIFHNDFWGRAMIDNVSHKSYRPLTVWTFRLNHMMSGHNPFSYHLVNVLLHLLASFLFTIVCKIFVFKDVKFATLAGTLFAVHPIHTEAVSGVVGRADVLCAVCFLLSYLTFLASQGMISTCLHHTISRLLFTSAILLAGCAMLAKEQGITVLAVCFCTELYQNHIIRKHGCRRDGNKNSHLTLFCLRSTTRLLLLLLATIGLLYMRLWIQGWQLPRFTEQDNPAAFSSSFITKMLTYSYLPVLNLWLLICPVRLSYDYQLNTVPLVTSLTDWRNVGTLLTSVIFCLISSKVLFKQGVPKRQITIGLLFLVLPFLPASNMFFYVGFVVAERLLYIPSMGFIILTVSGLQQMLKMYHSNRRLQWTSFMVLCVLLSGKTIARNRVWCDRETLFRSGLIDTPHNAKVHYNYANFLKDKGLASASREYYTNAIRLWPNYASAYNNLGTLLTNHTEAETHYKKALSIVPCHGNAHFNLGALLWAQSRGVEAIDSLKEAMKCDTRSVAPHILLATIYIELGLDEEAESTYIDAIRRTPDNANAYTHYADFLCMKGAKTDALMNLKHALEIDPNNHITMRLVGRLMAQIGLLHDAYIIFMRALSISEDPVTLDMAGMFFMKTGKLERAIGLCQKAYSAEPNQEAYGIHLALCLSEARRYNEAKDVLIKVIGSGKIGYEAPLMLANIYGKMKKHQEAIAVLEKTLHKVEDNGTAGMFYLGLGKHYRDLHYLDVALYYYQQAVLHNPELGEAHHNLGVFYHLRGDLERAREHYLHAVSIQPENLMLQRNLAKLLRVVSGQQAHNVEVKPRRQNTCFRPEFKYFECGRKITRTSGNHVSNTATIISLGSDEMNIKGDNENNVSESLSMDDVNNSNCSDSEGSTSFTDMLKTSVLAKTFTSESGFG